MKKTAVAKMFIVESEYLLWYLQDIFCIVCRFEFENALTNGNRYRFLS